MKIWKKLSAACLAAGLALSLAACGGSPGSSEPPVESRPRDPPPPQAARCASPPSP